MHVWLHSDKIRLQAVQLHVSGPNLPNLTILDLPGLRSQPTEEDSPAEKERACIIKAMVMKAAHDEGNLVVCIQP